MSNSHTIDMPDLDTKKIIEQINKNVNAIITEVASNQLITKVEKDSWETLLNNERNNVMAALNSLDSIQERIKIMENIEMTDKKWWNNIIDLVRQNKKISTVNANVNLASINAIIDSSRNMLDKMVQTQAPLQQAQLE
jgi:L-rhamnose mutarotase